MISKTLRNSIIHQMKKEAISIINNTRILIDNDKLYIIADTKNIPTREDFLLECMKHYQLSNDISIDDVQLRRVTIQSVVKESQSEAQDASSQRIQKKYRFTNLKLGTTVYALQVK